MARLARTAFLATLLVAAVAVAACGDDTTGRNRYVTELTAAQSRFTTTSERIQAEITPDSSPREDRRRLDRFAAAITDVIAALRRIQVPSVVVAEHRRLVGVYETWHADVARVTTVIKNPTRPGIARALRRIEVADQTFNENSRQAGIAIDAKLRS